jgi:hypothetical protein
MTRVEDPSASTSVNCAELLELHNPDVRRHVVQFYRDEGLMIEGVSHFTARALEAGDSSVLVATTQHRRQIERRLAASGLEVGALRSLGRCVSLDAEETLARIMVNGRPDAEKFNETIGVTIREAEAKSRNHFVAAFGEMVALLCAADQAPAAVELEQLWNALLASSRFSLCCAYPLATFDCATGLDAALRICDEHSLTLPA